MNTAQQYEAMTERIVADALAKARQRGEQEMTVARCNEICEQAVEAAFWARVRLRLVRQEWCR